jgi:hemerythrin-like domain-containing protein
MMAAGAPAEGGPIAVMLEEHAAGRALIRAMGADAPASQAEAARRYAELLRRHIEKENDVLFPLADALLDDADQDGVGRAFADLDAEGDDTAAAEAKVAELARALAP